MSGLRRAQPAVPALPMPGRRRRPRARVLALTTALAAVLTTALVCGPAAADPMQPLDRRDGTKAAAEPAAPGAPGGQAVAARATGRLVAIRQDSDGRRQALIGEQWLQAGQKLAQHTVAEIGPNHVELTLGKQRLTLHLLPPLIATRAPPARQGPRDDALARSGPAAGPPPNRQDSP